MLPSGHCFLSTKTSCCELIHYIWHESLAYVKAAGPDGERTAALLPFPPKGTAADGQLALAIPLRILHHGCSFSGNWQYHAISVFDTVSYFFVLLDTLDTFIYNTFGSLFHTFSLLRFIMPDKSHAHTRTNTHTQRAAAPVQGGRYFARQTPVSRIAKWVNEFNEGMMKVTSWTSQNESVLRFWQHIAQKLHRCLWDCIAQTWQQHLGHSIFGSSKWGSWNMWLEWFHQQQTYASGIGWNWF